MIKKLLVITILCATHLMALGQTKVNLVRSSFKKTYTIRQGNNVFVQHITDAPGEVQKLRILDLNDSLITLRQDQYTALIFPVSEISGFWIINGKAKAKMFAKTTVGLAWFIVGLSLFIVLAEDGEGYFNPYFLNQMAHVAAAAGGIYMVLSSNAKANATKIDLQRDNIIFIHNAR